MSGRGPDRSSLRAAALGLAALAVALGGAGCWVESVPPEERRDYPPSSGPPTSEIHAALDSSAGGWNRGDLATFLAPYRKSDSTTYIGSGGLRSGFSELRERYAPLFSGETARDSLRFRDVRVRGLGEDRALSVGRYTLFAGDSVTGTGWFSLVWERVQGRWWIIHDHSSAVPLPPDSAGPGGGG